MTFRFEDFKYVTCPKPQVQQEDVNEARAATYYEREKPVVMIDRLWEEVVYWRALTTAQNEEVQRRSDIN